MGRKSKYVPGLDADITENTLTESPPLLIGTLAEREAKKNRKSPTSMANIIRNAVRDARAAGKIPPEDE